MKTNSRRKYHEESQQTPYSRGFGGLLYRWFDVLVDVYISLINPSDEWI
jgi:hypothetical protein